MSMLNLNGAVRELISTSVHLSGVPLELPVSDYEAYADINMNEPNVVKKAPSNWYCCVCGDGPQNTAVRIFDSSFTRALPQFLNSINGMIL